MFAFHWNVNTLMFQMSGDFSDFAKAAGSLMTAASISEWMTSFSIEFTPKLMVSVTEKRISIWPCHVRTAHTDQFIDFRVSAPLPYFFSICVPGENT